MTAVERLIPALRNSLEGAARPFCVPGSQLLLKPDIYVTIIAWTPFLTSDAQLVIHQGRISVGETKNVLLLTKKMYTMKGRGKK